MLTKKIGIILILLLTSLSFASAQKTIKGSVSGIGDNGAGANTQKLAFANVYWVGGNHSESTDQNGEFKISRAQNGETRLVASYVGYANDTVVVEPGRERVDFVLKSNATLSTVEISGGGEGSYISKMSTIKTEITTEAGLQKLACCNLSESFENSATVDVGYSDAVSGAKKIQMLGLSGIYSQLMLENVPNMRGLASNYGLSYIPGSWMQSIQVSKGTSSVINGYESTTGQINVEYKKPEHTPEKLFLNLYGSDDARLEMNMNVNLKVNDHIGTMFLTHASFNSMKIDHNKDGFMDIPIGWQANITNRWTFDSPKGNHTQLILNYLQDSRNGGQIGYYNQPEGDTTFRYGTSVETRRAQGILKSGFRFKNPWQSLGIIASGTWHQVNSMFGKTTYDATQTSAYANIIYQTMIVNTNNLVSVGASFNFDDTRELLKDSAFRRDEAVPGIFGQYTLVVPEKVNLIVGLRSDYNSLYGFLLTPRIHLRWNLTKSTTLRASAGAGHRSPNMIAENMSLLASNRVLHFEGDVKMEHAWNYGINLLQEFSIDEVRKITLSADFYRTDFTDRMVIDLDRDVHGISFYNIKGRSWSNSLQVELTVQPVKRFDISAAFRWNDSKTAYDGVLRETPFVSKYKGLLTLSYATKFEKWKFDLTAQYNGKSRLPYTGSSPEPYARPDYSHEYYILHAQVTKRFRLIDIYLGGENLLNYRQHHPIVSADNTESKYFDASMIWGPLMGRTFYAGLRLKIK
jgi:outer membrane cobalamin receptor